MSLAARKHFPQVHRWIVCTLEVCVLFILWLITTLCWGRDGVKPQSRNKLTLCKHYSCQNDDLCCKDKQVMQWRRDGREAGDFCKAKIKKLLFQTSNRTCLEMQTSLQSLRLQTCLSSGHERPWAAILWISFHSCLKLLLFTSVQRHDGTPRLAELVRKRFHFLQTTDDRGCSSLWCNPTLRLKAHISILLCVVLLLQPNAKTTCGIHSNVHESSRALPPPPGGRGPANSKGSKQRRSSIANEVIRKMFWN